MCYEIEIGEFSGSTVFNLYLIVFLVYFYVLSFFVIYTLVLVAFVLCDLYEKVTHNLPHESCGSGLGDPKVKW
jgi:hypothetical protein